MKIVCTYLFALKLTTTSTATTVTTSRLVFSNETKITPVSADSLAAVVAEAEKVVVQVLI